VGVKGLKSSREHPALIGRLRFRGVDIFGIRRR
jgi:hypothetical protein